MAYRLDEMNRIDAAFAIAKRYPGGVEALANVMHVSASVLYKKLEHGCDTHHLREDEFEEIIARCAAAGVPDAYKPLRALCFRFGHVAVKLPELGDQSSAELAEMVMRCFKEGGDVARVVEEAVSVKSRGGRGVTPGELRAIEMEIEQAMGALAELRERARALADQPALRLAK